MKCKNLTCFTESWERMAKNWCLVFWRSGVQISARRLTNLIQNSFLLYSVTRHECRKRTLNQDTIAYFRIIFSSTFTIIWRDEFRVIGGIVKIYLHFRSQYSYIFVYMSHNVCLKRNNNTAVYKTVSDLSSFLFMYADIIDLLLIIANLFISAQTFEAVYEIQWKYQKPTFNTFTWTVID